MDAMQRPTLFLAILLLLSTSVAAASYQVEFTAENNSILHNEQATFDLTITNYEESMLRFQLYTLDTDWVMDVNPPVNIVRGGENKSYTIGLSPKSTIGFGSQGITVLLKELGENAVLKRNLIVYVIDPNQRPGVYAPSVRLDVAAPPAADPRSTLHLDLAFQNRNALNIEGGTVAISSPLFERVVDLDLAPLVEKSVRASFDLDPTQAAGEYPLTVTLTYNDRRVNQVTTSFAVAEVHDLTEQPVDEGGFLRTATTITVRNGGNVVEEHQTLVATNWLRNLFTRVTPKTGTEKIGGQRYHAWSLTLEPQEEATLVLVENYRFLALLILLLLVGTATYYVVRSPLIAVKETIAEDSTKLKVRVYLKNRTGKTIDGVTVVDRVPGIATYVKQNTLGVLHPSKVVQSEKKGTVLKWDVDLLEPYEERILSYNMTSKLQIVGKMKLPAAKVTYERRGKEKTTYTRAVTGE